METKKKSEYWKFMRYKKAQGYTYKEAKVEWDRLKRITS